MHWKNFIPFSLSNSSNLLYSLMNACSDLESFTVFSYGISSVRLGGIVFPSIVFSGSFSSLTPALEEGLISFLVVRRVLDFVFLTSVSSY